MLPANLLNTIKALALPQKSLPTTTNETASKAVQFELGQKLQGIVQDQIAPNVFKVNVTGQLIQMQLPASVRSGDTIMLQVITNQPRLTFSMVNSANPLSTPEQLGSAARLLSSMSQQAPEKAFVRAAQSAPLWDKPQPPESKQLSGLLREALSNSGLFYESHQAQWVEGTRSTAQLLHEPQNLTPEQARVVTAGNTAGRVVIANEASGKTTMASDTSGKDVTASFSSGKAAMMSDTYGKIVMANDASGKTPMADDASGKTATASESYGKTAMASDAPGKTAMAIEAYGKTAMASEVSGKSAMSSDAPGQAAMMSDAPGQAAVMSDTANPSVATSNAANTIKADQLNMTPLSEGKALGIPEHLQPLVQQQLNALETRQMVWQGNVWPEQPMQWEVHEQPPQTPGAEEQQQWVTQLRLDLPNLGEVAATLRFNSMGLSLTLNAGTPETRAMLGNASTQLVAAMSDVGIPVLSTQVTTI